MEARLIDPTFYAPFAAIEDRFDLLGAEERATIDTIVQTKMQQANEDPLVSHYSIGQVVNL